MNRLLCLVAAGLYLCLQSQVTAEYRLSRSSILNAVSAAKASVDSAYQYSRATSLERVRRQTTKPSDILQLTKQPVGLTRVAVRAADYMDYAVTLLKNSLQRRQKRSINATDLISEEDLKLIADLTGCSPRHRMPNCRTTPNLERFRTVSSVCNNMKNTRWGSSNTHFARWLPAEYQDKIAQPKGWDSYHMVNNHLLPMVREVSNRILRAVNSEVENDSLYTPLVTFFGQLTDHDITFTPHSPVIRSFSNGIDCDKSCERTEPCFPIEIPMNDTRLGSHSEECMPFFRSAAACGSGNTGNIFGARNVREQMNSITTFIDATHVYGSEDVKAAFLRDLTSDQGLMKVNTEFTDNGRELLPFSPMSVNMCATRARITNDSSAKEHSCFVAGDERSNENIALTSLHTLFVREHNRLARALAVLNPHWNGERLYQEARKIVGGYLQVITFRDYLPHIVGPDSIAEKLSNYPGYDENVDPSISNVFATAAYRFAHLMIQPFVFRLDEEYMEHPDYPSPLLHKAFFAPWRVIDEGGLDPIMRGMMGRRAKLNTQEKMMADELRERLFKFSTELALDLGALNMQRGRDHGLPGYNKWREYCGLSQPQNLAELAEVLNNTHLASELLDLYGTPDNIDVWLGGVAEPFVKMGRVGPLFACLISIQFQKLRQGDRLWWENNGVFTAAQRMSLRETSLARIICDNTGITDVPEHPFQYRPRGFGYTSCDNITDFDLSPWSEGYEDGLQEQGPRGPRGLPGPPGPPSNMEKIAFTVRLGLDLAKPSGRLIFHEVIYNGQNAYDTRTGHFTCVIPGVYLFQFHCLITRHPASLDLMRNGDVILHSYTTTHQSGHVIASGSAYVKLLKGDMVWLNSRQRLDSVSKESVLSGQLVFVE